jgi:glycosyltransferase involved in cell wall biosynthesis
LSEAGAAGLPLISTTIGAIPEIVEDGRTGFTVPVRDVDALTTALRRLVVDSDLRHRLGDNACELVRERFDADTNVGLLVSCLRDVASGH